MATYNGERFIRQQLDSFSAQTYRPNELVVTDDGSTDRTLAIVREFAASAPFEVRIYENPQRLDYPRNFERAILLCVGEIILLSDQDDVWFPEKIGTVVAFLDAHPAMAVVVNDQLLTNLNLQHQGVTKLENLKRAGKSSDALIEGCCTALRRSWGELLLPLDRRLEDFVASRDISHDSWINDLAIALGVRGVIEKPLQYFRRTGSNTTSWLLSEPRAVRLNDRARHRQAAAPREAWLRHAQVLSAYGQFIRAHRDSLPGNTDRALLQIDQRQESFRRRAELSGMSLPAKLTRIWRLWRSGGYKYFEGCLSAFSDVLRGK
jgi:glycosyltransferase involved in cell wall biosynthesis